MAGSCSAVMYGAYYPYLYGRGARYHHAHHFQYDRGGAEAGFSSGGGGGVGGVGVGSGALPSAAAATSPPQLLHQRLRAKEEDHGRTSADGLSSESEGECGGAGGSGGAGGGGRRAQYVSANCVVFTHYSGDVAAVVDEHFARALSLDKQKECVPLVSRDLPASFFNASATQAATGHPPACAVDLYEYDPWHQHYSGYGAHRHAAEYHAAAAASAAHHNMAAGVAGVAGYGGLLLRPPLQYKHVDWQHSHIDPACASYSYPPVHGLEAQVQDTSKDLYWF